MSSGPMGPSITENGCAAGRFQGRRMVFSALPMPDAFHALEEAVTRDVTRALAEDIGSGDLTAALVPAGRVSRARLMTRQSGVLCGIEWFVRTFEELDPD